jgi:hypothetical protein
VQLRFDKTSGYLISVLNALHVPSSRSRLSFRTGLSRTSSARRILARSTIPTRFRSALYVVRRCWRATFAG